MKQARTHTHTQTEAQTQTRTQTQTQAQTQAQAQTAARTGRLFVALWPDETVRQALQAWQAEVARRTPARLTPAADLHLTLSFIGPQPAQRLADVIGAIEVAAEPCELVLDHAEAWRGGLVVLRPSAPLPAALVARQRAVEAGLAQRGLPFDRRRFKPHVTLARDAAAAVSLAGVEAGPVVWRVTCHVLAAREGAGYRVLHRPGARPG